MASFECSSVSISNFVPILQNSPAEAAAIGGNKLRPNACLATNCTVYEPAIKTVRPASDALGRIEATSSGSSGSCLNRFVMALLVVVVVIEASLDLFLELAYFRFVRRTNHFPPISVTERIDKYNRSSE